MSQSQTLSIVRRIGTGRRLVSHENNNLANPTQRRAALWFALLSVAWLQLAVAIHQFDHVAEYVDDSCQVCIQLDRADDAVANHASSTAIEASVDAPAWQAPAGIVVRALIRGFDARAPPQL